MAYKYRAAGAIVLRGSGDDTEVLVIHRKRYDDWSLPKGGVEDGETEPVAAVREVLEETGHRIRLTARMQPTRHVVKERTKVVSWWLGELLDQRPVEHDDEADRVEWWPVGRALAQLNYPTDLSVLTEAVRYHAQDGTQRVPLLIVRHGKAMPRRQFKGDDDTLRPLAARGERQAEALVEVLAAFGVHRLASSSSKRCMDTFAPYAEAAGLKIHGYDELGEGPASENPRAVAQVMRQIRDKAVQQLEPTAVCGHRPVLPTMIDALGFEIDHSLETAEAIHLTTGPSGQPSQPSFIPPEI